MIAIPGLRGLWNHRYFILTSVRSDFQNRVARSRLGFLWLIIAPLSQVLIYAFILSALMSQRLPGIDNRFSYAIYLLAGFLGWFLFVEIVNKCLTAFIENGNIMKKISFPRSIIPIVIALTALISNLLFLAIVVVVYLVMGHTLSWHILWLPLVTLITIGFSVGIGLTVGILNVFVRDMGQLIAIVLQILFWFTPIVYTTNILPPAIQNVLMLNPLFWIIDTYHRVLAYNVAPNFVALGLLSVLSLVFLALSLWLFRRASAEMVDVL